MYKEFNSKFPKMKPLVREVYGKLVFLAGCENEHHRSQLYDAGIRDILVSYYYLRKKNDASIIKQLERFENVLLDSGGYTYIQQGKKGKAPTDDEVKYYTEDYMKYCEKMHEHFNFVFEMDFTWQIGKEYRDAVLHEMHDNGIHMVPIIHASLSGDLEGNNFFEYPLVALAGDITGGTAGPHAPIIRKLMDKGILIHGLAATDEASVNRVPYFSVDSSSWISGAQWGLTYIFRGGKIITYSAKDKKRAREANKYIFEQAGLNWEGIAADKHFDVNVMNAFAWRQWIQHIQNNMAQSYWLTDYEKAQAKDKMREQMGVTTTGTAVEAFEKEARNPSTPREIPVKSYLPEDASAYLDPRMAAPLVCNACSLSHVCPQYEANAQCAWNTIIKVSGLSDLIGVMGAQISMQHSRISQANLAEKLQGGALDPNLSKEMTTLMKMVQVAQGLLEKGAPPPSNIPGEVNKSPILESMFEEEEDFIIAEYEEKETTPEEETGYPQDLPRELFE